MSPISKIKSHKTLDELFASIAADKISRDIASRRYPVRFILFDNFPTFQEFSTRLRSEGKGIVNIDLETLIETDRDHWITSDAISQAIAHPKDATSKYFLVSPVSEIIRFYKREKFHSFLNEYSLLENRNLERIYIPLIGLRNRFHDFLTHFSRITESAPVWAVTNDAEPQKPLQIFLLPSDSDASKFELPSNFKCKNSFYDWLVFWKTKSHSQLPSEPIFFASDVLNAFYENAQPDNIFQITKIENASEFLKNVLHISIPFEYSASDEAFWKHLLVANETNWTSQRSFSEFILAHFNVKRITAKNLIQIWTKPETDAFSRWLLKNTASNSLKTENPYLCEILSSELDLLHENSLLGKIACKITETSKFDEKTLAERRELLEAFPPKIPLSQREEIALAEFIDKLASQNFDLALKVCTGRFNFEYERFILWFQNGKLPLESLKISYPQIANYLEPISSPNSTISDYLSTYKLAKLRDEYITEISTLLSKLNESERSFWKWHSTFKSAHDLLAPEINSTDAVYWLDGVGAEWLPLMLAKIKNSAFDIEKTELAAARIPSTTENNRFSNEKITKRDALDNFAHSNFYRYPNSICREIQIIEELMDEILAQTSLKKIVIVSDHGLSALSRLLDGKNCKENAAHEGREVEVSFAGVSDSNYLYTKGENGKQYCVALKHSSLGSKPVREVHGGCTPEEVLVPFIVISKKINIGNIASPTPKKTPQPSPASEKQKPKTIESKLGFDEEEIF